LKSQALTLFDLVERLSLLTRADLRQAGAAQGLQPVHLQVLFYLNQANRFSNTPQALTAGAPPIDLALRRPPRRPGGAADPDRRRHHAAEDAERRQRLA
jgi:hypothetical protein